MICCSLCSYKLCMARCVTYYAWGSIIVHAISITVLRLTSSTSSSYFLDFCFLPLRLTVAMCAGQNWMNLAPNHDGSHNQFDGPMMTGQPGHSSASGMHFGHHGANCMNQAQFDPNCHPGDDRGLDSIDSHHQLSAHQGVCSHAACSP